MAKSLIKYGWMTVRVRDARTNEHLRDALLPLDTPMSVLAIGYEILGYHTEILGVVR